MTGQKGGHKDRIRTWKIIYRRRKQEKLILQNQLREKKRLERKKQKELEQQYRLTARERSLSWVYLIFGLFFGVLERKASTPKQKKVVIEIQPGKKCLVNKVDGEKLISLEKEVLHIEKRMKQLISDLEQPSKETILHVKSEVAQIKQTVAGISSIYQEIKQEYKKGNDSRLENSELIESSFPQSSIKTIQMSSSIENTMGAIALAESVILEKEQLSEQSEVMFPPKEEVILEQAIPFVEVVEANDKVEAFTAMSESKEVTEYIKTTTKELKEKAKKMKVLQNEIVCASDEFIFQQKRQELKYLRDDIFKMQLKHDEMDRLYGFYHYGVKTKAYELDQFHLLEHPRAFSKLVVEADQILEQKFQSKKQEGEIKREEKKEIKKDLNQFKNQDFLNEIEQSEQMVQAHIDAQKKSIQTLKLKLRKHSTAKKRSVFHLQTIGNMVFNVTKLVAGFFSFSLFKNKAVGLLTGAFFINNGVRGLKHALQPDLSMKYYDMSQMKHMLKEQSDCFSYTQRLLEDSTVELADVKKNFVEKFAEMKDSLEYQTVLNQILQIESDLNVKKQELMAQQEQMNMEKGKMKQLEKRYYDNTKLD